MDQTLKLYCVTFDGTPEFIEAGSFSGAIDIWSKHLRAENPGDYDEFVEPESVQLIHEGPVLR